MTTTALDPIKSHAYERREVTDPDVTQCPDWCQLPPGHYWEGSDGVGYLGRDHVRRIATIPVEDGNDRVQVDIRWAEYAAEKDASDDVAVPRHEPTVDACVDAELTAAEARRLGAAILQAAELLDKINGARS